MKKILIILSGFFCVLFCIQIISAQFGEPISVDSMLIVFDGRQENLSNSINIVAVAGWSRDGKVAIVQAGSNMYPFWIILDTVTDKVIDEHRVFGAESEYDTYDKLAAAIQVNKITYNPGSLVSLPYSLPKNMQPLKIEYDVINQGEQPKMYAVRGNKRKKISSVDIPGNNPEIKATYAVKSPFENRLLIITHVSSEHIEFDYMFYSFNYAGCHLTAGF
jgi:hypothetical protein